MGPSYNPTTRVVCFSVKVFFIFFKGQRYVHTHPFAEMEQTFQNGEAAAGKNNVCTHTLGILKSQMKLHSFLELFALGDW